MRTKERVAPFAGGVCLSGVGAPETIRIFSDIHFLEGPCRVRSLDQLRPLLDGADSLILNGDSLDTQNADPDGSITAELRAFFPAHVPRATFITGNHDPDISEIHEVSLAEGRVWVTHGDIIFPDMTPWSRFQPEIVRRLAAARGRGAEGKNGSLETRLRHFRQAALGLPREHDPAEKSLLTRLWHLCNPPRCSLAVLQSWFLAPRLAAALAAAHRPAARVIIKGHTHFPGVWRRRCGRVVINTGSFSGPLEPRLVELCGERLRVRAVVVRGGEFHPGGTISEIHLASPRGEALSPES